MRKPLLLLFTLMGSFTGILQAREIQGVAPTGGSGSGKLDKSFFTMAAGCKAPTAQVDLDINNVRTTIMNGGDMWWNLVNAKYEVPKVTDPNGIRKHSIFSGALWIGGLDDGGNLKLAAMTYRQNGVDFFAGALDTRKLRNPNIEIERCDYYDRIYKISREEIESHIKDYTDNGVVDNPIKALMDWPGNPDPGYGEDAGQLAPYVDTDNNGIYNPLAGDYPDVFGDQALWFVYNDVGNIHTETQGAPIGLQLKTMAFSFATNDEINNMTFYQTKVKNFGEPVNNTYFGQWVDPDLGNYSDDYVGCDVDRNLGYCYNGDDNDEGILGYGLNPPTVGVDFFKGPNDENGKEIGLSYFVYYNNDFTNIGNPFRPIHFYNFLKGLWHDGSPITFGGTGVGGTDTTRYMFPGDPVSNTGWTEKSAGNQPADRRFLQTSGPFKLETGVQNEVTVGVVWARSSIGGATGSLNLLRLADDKAQELFFAGFKLFDGPRSPDLVANELDREVVLSLENSIETESYEAKRRNSIAAIGVDSLIYKFQGYQIYQLKDGSVTTGDLENTEKARLLYQVDLQDNVSALINRVFDPTVSQYVPALKVNGNNTGIRHTFSVKEDLFATGNKELVNFKSYYFLVISYASLANDVKALHPEQYLAGRKNVKIIQTVPHKTLPVGGGSDIGKVGYGTGPKIKRIEGTGNGGNSLKLTKESIDEILKNGKMDQPIYENGHGPISIKVIDPTRVPKGNFELFISEPSAPSTSIDSLNGKTAIWTLRNLTTNETITSDGNIEKLNEKIIRQWGLSVNIRQVNRPGNIFDEFDKSNGYIESSIEFVQPSKPWLDGISDQDGPNYLNWIRSGNNGSSSSFGGGGNDDYKYTYDFIRAEYSSGNIIGSSIKSLDPFEVFEKVCDRKMAPYALCARALRDANGRVTYGPAFEGSPAIQDAAANENRLADLASIDLVLTPDKSKWTQCVVLEMSESDVLAEGGRKKFSIRDHASWTGEFDANGNPVYDQTDRGRSWFPGYAINLETGERLNIMFGEDSFLKGENGGDMLWNPTSTAFNLNGPVYGGKHHIFVCGRNKFNRTTYVAPFYDKGENYKKILDQSNGNPTTGEKRKVMSQIMWVMMPYLASGFTLDPKTIVPADGEVSFQIRMSKPYAKYTTSGVNQGYPYYTFNTDDLAPVTGTEVGKKSMDLVNVVPNPYYASSKYESSQLDTRVKITNLPPKCAISIYTMSGILVRRIRKDDDNTFIDWDLKNQAQVPIGSGLFLIHVDGYELGEKVIKWFGVMRPVDLDTF